MSSTDPGSFVNATAGTVAGVSHLGDVLQFVVHTESGSDLIARLPRHQAPKLVPGDPVWCAWSPEHAYVFSADQADRVIIDPVDETVSVAPRQPEGATTTMSTNEPLKDPAAARRRRSRRGDAQPAPLPRRLGRDRHGRVAGGLRRRRRHRQLGRDDGGRNGRRLGAGTAAGSGGGDFDRELNLFTWAEYDDEDLLASWGDIQPTIYNSNEEAIQKLAAAGGNSRLRHGRARPASTSRRWSAKAC